MKDNEISSDVSPQDFKPSEAPKLGDTLLRVPASSYLNYLVTKRCDDLAFVCSHGFLKSKGRRGKSYFSKAIPRQGVEIYRCHAHQLARWWNSLFNSATTVKKEVAGITEF